ncbi:MAG: ribonuclease HI [Planctomycetaceae bacterium]|jgi:ribonuclease HI
MPSSLAHRGGSKRLGGAGIRQEEIDARTGERYEFLRRHRWECAKAVSGDSEVRSRIADELFDRATDPRNMKCAVDHLYRYGGPAPGPNGLILQSFEQDEQWELSNALSVMLRNGWYEVGPERCVERPKGGNRGNRTLTIQNVEDRVVQRAILQVLEPLIDPTFQDESMGYRPHVGWFHALARAEAIMRYDGLRVAIVEDLKNAFDTVPLQRLMDLVRKKVPNDVLTGVIEHVIERDGQKRGLRQGGSLSAFLLNIYLDHVLDRRWKKEQSETRLVRVADDLLILCEDVSQAREAYCSLQKLLRPTGMTLKGNGDSGVHDLRETSIEWLGLRLGWNGEGLTAHVTHRKWDRLREQLQDAHWKRNPTQSAEESILMWVEQLGPCRASLCDHSLCGPVERIAQECGFEELPTRDQLRERLLRGNQSWCGIRDDSFRAYVSCSARGSACAPRRIQPDSRLSSGASETDADRCCPQRPRSVVLHTDGSCLMDDELNVGGWAFIKTDGTDTTSVEDSGAECHTTNNRMEVLAAIRGFESIEFPSNVRLVTDSKYLGRGIVDWLGRWKANGWRRGRDGRNGHPANLDLWQRLDALLEGHEVEVDWVPGHSGHPENERCDELARQAANGLVGTLEPRLEHLGERSNGRDARIRTADCRQPAPAS